jgi:hypothetical protein
MKKNQFKLLQISFGGQETIMTRLPDTQFLPADLQAKTILLKQ